MKSIFFTVLLILCCSKIYSQSGSTENFKTGFIYSVEYKDTDSTENEIDEVRIYSASDTNLEIGYMEDTIETYKSISMLNLQKIGYKNGKSSGKYTGIGLIAGLGTGIILSVIEGSKGKGGHENGYAALGIIAIFIATPIIGAVTGAIVGAYIDRYLEYDLTKFQDIKTKSKRVKMIIKDGLKYHH